MIRRKLGPSPLPCTGGHHCPDILECEDGNYAIIGADVTDQLAHRLPPGVGCGPTERIVLIPRGKLVLARPDIPSSMYFERFRAR